MAPADRFIHWLGKFHLLLLHFPIALVLAAGVGETRSVWQRNPIPSESVRFCLWLGALAAIPTAGLGWLFAAAGNGVGSPQLLTAHRWLGTSVPCGCSSQLSAPNAMPTAGYEVEACGFC